MILKSTFYEIKLQFSEPNLWHFIFKRFQLANSQKRFHVTKLNGPAFKNASRYLNIVTIYSHHKSQKNNIAASMYLV